MGNLADSVDDGYRTILGVRFFGGTAAKAIAKIREGGLLVVPAAPALKDMDRDVDYRDALHWYAEFLRHHLAHGGAQTGADIHLTRIDGDGTIGMHSEETVDLFQVERFSEIGAGA